MSYLELEKEYDRAVVFMAAAASRAETLPVASVLHSIRVGLELHRDGYAKDVVLGGFLHDVVEDTEVTVEQVGDQFGDRVAVLVAAMTFNTELPGEEQSRDSQDRCVELGKEALAIKAADWQDNLRSYLAEANPAKLEQVARSLEYFLNTSVGEFGAEGIWADLKGMQQQIRERTDG